MEGIWLVTFVLQSVIIIFILLLVIGILRYLSSVKERWDLAVPKISSYELGQTIDDIELTSIDNRAFRLLELAGRLNGALLLFTTSGCSSCATLMQQTIDIFNRSEGQLEKMFVIVGGSSKDLQHLLNDYPSLKNDQVVLLCDEKFTALSRFGILSMPTALAVSKEGRLIDQTFNPHITNWLYKVANIKPPEAPISTGRVAVFTPAAYQRN